MNDNERELDELMGKSPVTVRVGIHADLGDGEGEQRIDLLEPQILPFDTMLELRRATVSGDLDVSAMRNDAMVLGGVIAATLYADGELAGDELD